MNYVEAVQYLLGLGHETLTMKLGLQSTELLLQALGNPQRSYPSVQVAGTNGKGSVVTILDAICRAASIKTGLYTSPHLVSITERIKLGGSEICKDDFASCASEVRSAAEKLVAEKMLPSIPTFFEQMTAMALLAFRNQGVQLAILETGLGGRLDSTTVAMAQVVAITPVAIDHEAYLGNTISSIAAEKAAIIRPDVKAIIGKQSQEALDTILERCAKCDVTPRYPGYRATIEEWTADGLFRVTYKTDSTSYDKVWLGLRGRHQIDNTGIAIALAEALQSLGFSISQGAIVAGVGMARHAGRLELISGSPNFLLDGAHNPAGATMLREHLEQFVSRPLTLIFGAMRDKPLEQIAAQIFPIVDQLILTPVDHPRSATPDILEPIARSLIGEEKIFLAKSGADALRFALSKTSAAGTICITGSLYLIGEMRPLVLALSSTRF